MKIECDLYYEFHVAITTETFYKTFGEDKTNQIISIITQNITDTIQGTEFAGSLRNVLFIDGHKRVTFYNSEKEPEYKLGSMGNLKIIFKVSSDDISTIEHYLKTKDFLPADRLYEHVSSQFDSIAEILKKYHVCHCPHYSNVMVSAHSFQNFVISA